jgi:hypothetical protein
MEHYTAVWNNEHSSIIKYECKCGSTIKPSSLRQHLKTKKHQSYIASLLNTRVEEKECDICYEIKSQHFKCSVCNNTHCLTCHNNLLTPNCPFCRSAFIRDVKKEEEEAKRRRIINTAFGFIGDRIADLRRLGLNEIEIIETIGQIVFD